MYVMKANPWPGADLPLKVKHASRWSCGEEESVAPPIRRHGGVFLCSFPLMPDCGKLPLVIRDLQPFRDPEGIATYPSGSLPGSDQEVLPNNRVSGPEDIKHYAETDSPHLPEAHHSAGPVEGQKHTISVIAQQSC